MALEHQKWDAQVGDAADLAPYLLLVSGRAWKSLRPRHGARPGDLRHGAGAGLAIGPPRATGASSRPRRRARCSSDWRALAPASPRIMRFDFHPTLDGWRVSEVNSDVPGGFTEASRFARLVGRGGRSASSRATPLPRPGATRSRAADAPGVDVALPSRHRAGSRTCRRPPRLAPAGAGASHTSRNRSTSDGPMDARASRATSPAPRWTRSCASIRPSGWRGFPAASPGCRSWPEGEPR